MNVDDDTRQLIDARFQVETKHLNRQFEVDAAQLRETLSQKGLLYSTNYVSETLRLESKRYRASLDLMLNLSLQYVHDGDELDSLDLGATFKDMFQGAVRGAMVRISVRHRTLLRGDLEEYVKQPFLEPLAEAAVRLRTEIHRLRCVQSSAPADTPNEVPSVGPLSDTSAGVEAGDEVIELKPNVFGFGIDLRALWRKYGHHLKRWRSR